MSFWRTFAAASAAALMGVATLQVSAMAKDKPPNLWAAAKKPSKGPSKAVGTYNAGCVIGAVALPDAGKGFQLARPGRRRQYGHSELIDFIEDLGRQTVAAKAGVLLVGDLGQVRGGPSPSGHSSHQSGLDADIWFWHPRSAEKRALSKKKRRKVAARNMVSTKTKKRTKHWSSKVAKVLKLASADDRVARIFVNPIIKKELCTATAKQTKEQRAWLAKLRPWWGHNAHFHVRLACPEGSDECVDQDPVGDSDGCSEIDWWLDDKAQAERKKKRKTYRKTIGTRPKLPATCDALVAK